jgi:hypothetical protein
MVKKGVRHTTRSLNSAREGSRSDGDRAGAKSYAEIEADVAGDAAEDGMTVDWAQARSGLPEPKAPESASDG